MVSSVKLFAIFPPYLNSFYNVGFSNMIVCSNSSLAVPFVRVSINLPVLLPLGGFLYLIATVVPSGKSITCSGVIISGDSCVVSIFNLISEGSIFNKYFFSHSYLK